MLGERIFSRAFKFLFVSLNDNNRSVRHSRKFVFLHFSFRTATVFFRTCMKITADKMFDAVYIVILVTRIKLLSAGNSK